MSEKRKGGGSQPMCFGSIWGIGWLFTIGWLQLGFWKGVLAIAVWPYYIGVAVRALSAAAG